MRKVMFYIINIVVMIVLIATIEIGLQIHWERLQWRSHVETIAGMRIIYVDGKRWMEVTNGN